MTYPTCPLALIDLIALRIAEIMAMQPMTIEQFNEMKGQPNATHYDELYTDDNERWGDHD